MGRFKIEWEELNCTVNILSSTLTTTFAMNVRETGVERKEVGRMEDFFKTLFYLNS